MLNNIFTLHVSLVQRNLKQNTILCASSCLFTEVNALWSIQLYIVLSIYLVADLGGGAQPARAPPFETFFYKCPPFLYMCPPPLLKPNLSVYCSV